MTDSCITVQIASRTEWLTGKLRFVERQSTRASIRTWPHPETYTERVLQQEWCDIYGKTEWRDVPTEKETA